jgi:hypothetical protein
MLEFTYRGKTYEILKEQTDREGDEGRGEQILRDFEYCKEVRDWTTIKNRILGGTTHGWLKEK